MVIHVHHNKSAQRTPISGYPCNENTILPRVPLRFALGYALVALAGRSSPMQLYRLWCLRLLNWEFTSAKLGVYESTCQLNRVKKVNKR